MMKKYVHCGVVGELFRIIVFSLAFYEVKTSVSSPSLTISPHHAHIDQGQTASVMCRLDRQIVACQFHLSLDPKTIIDFSGGVGATALGNTSWYDGAGLEAGECGIKIPHTTLSDVSDWFVLGCRVRAERAGWMYGDMTIYVDNQVVKLKPYNIVESNYPDQVIVLKTETLQVAYRLVSKVTDPTAACNFEIPGFNTRVEPEQDKVDNIFSYNKGSSQCGIEIRNVNEEYNGWMWPHLSTATNMNFPFPKTSIIVAKFPEDTDMIIKGRQIRYQQLSLTYEEGETLNANCHAASSRPVANLTWFFGDDVIRNDDDDDSPVSGQDNWRWDYDEQSIMQNISRKITWMDDGKELICQITHLAYGEDNGVNDSMLIEVNHAKWGIVPTELLFEDLTVGRAGVLVVDTGLWNIARPTFLWRVKNITIREEYMDEEYEYHSSRAVQENGKWISTLIIMGVRVEDMEHPFLLIAGDDSERREYLVTVTTVDLKLWYFFITLTSGVTVVLLVLGLIYNRDIRHWFSDPRRYDNEGRVVFNNDIDDEDEEHF